MFLLSLLLSAHAATVDRIAATVNDEVVTWSEIYDMGGPFIEQRCGSGMDGGECRREAELEVLDALVLRALIKQELDALGMAVTAEEVDRAIDSVSRDQLGTDREGLRREVERSGMSWETYRVEITRQIQQMKFNEVVVRPRVTVSDDELLDRYKRQVRELSTESVRKLEAVQIPMPSADPLDQAGLMRIAADLALQVNAGEQEWSKVLEEYDSGYYRKRNGEMGTFSRDQLNETLAEAAFDTPVGQVSQPVQVPGGVYLIRVVEETSRQADVAPFDEAKAALRDAVYQEKIDEETEQWYLQARRRASVNVLLESQ